MIPCEKLQQIFAGLLINALIAYKVLGNKSGKYAVILGAARCCQE